MAEDDVVARTEALVANKALLRSLIETGSLLSWVNLEGTRFGLWGNYDVPTIDEYCPRCHREMPFKGGHFLPHAQEISANDVFPGSVSVVVKYSYQCAICEVKSRSYFLELDLFCKGLHRVRKLGQFPPVSIKLDADVVKYLEKDDAGLLRKGRIAELQGYGIGALAYYRRVVVSVTGKLLQDLRDVLVVDELEEDVKRLDEILSDHRESDRLKHAAALLPKRMRPGNANPFGLLFGGISAAMKTMSEEDALKRAQQMSESLITVIRNLSSTAVEARRYDDAIKEMNKSPLPTQQQTNGDAPKTESGSPTDGE